MGDATLVFLEKNLDNLAANLDRDEILASYPSLTSEDIDASVAYAAERVSVQETGLRFTMG